MKTVSITATEDGTGKTAIALALGCIARDRGIEVGYMKPKGTRLQSHVGKVLDTDPMLARELLGLDAELQDLEPIVYSPTFIQNAVRGKETPAELRDRIRTAFDALAVDRDLLLVEGAGRLSTGRIIDCSDPQLAALLDTEVLLVADFEQLRDLDELLSTLDAIGDRLLGIVFNGVRNAAFEELERDAIPFLETHGYPIVGVLPYERELAGVTVEEFAAELGAEQLTSVSDDAYLERFLLGAMGGTEALSRFRRTRNAVVITGGDRSEIHTAAIEASGVECLVVTGSHRPSATVLGEAQQAGLPVLAVSGETLSIVERTEEILNSGRTQDAETVDRMCQLLTDHADVEAILDGTR